MINLQPLNILPQEIQQKWSARLYKALPTQMGVFRLVNIRPTEGRSYEGQRIIVLVVDENGFPLPNVKVAFSYSTANYYPIDANFLWTPPSPQKAFIVPTGGNGQIDQIQGSGVKQGEPGGVTVYILEPEFSSDYVAGCGMLADHTGLHLTFRLIRTGVISISEQLADIEARLTVLENNG